MGFLGSAEGLGVYRGLGLEIWVSGRAIFHHDNVETLAL